MNIITNPIEQVTGGLNTNPETYGFVSTKDVLNRLQDMGWEVNKTQVNTVRKVEKQGFQKHLITLTNPAFGPIEGLRDKTVPTIVMLNSHDASTAFKFWLGLFRFACLNGIISGTAFDNVRVIHSANAVKKLPDAIERLIVGLPRMIELVSKLANTQVSPERAKEFIKECYNARLEGIGKVVNVDYRANPIRTEDMSNDAFTLFNRVQERLVRGGIHYTYERDVKIASLDGKEGTITEIRNSTTRPIRSITQSVNVNKAVFDAAMKLAA